MECLTRWYENCTSDTRTLYKCSIVPSFTKHLSEHVTTATTMHRITCTPSVCYTQTHPYSPLNSEIAIEYNVPVLNNIIIRCAWMKQQQCPTTQTADERRMKEKNEIRTYLAQPSIFFSSLSRSFVLRLTHFHCCRRDEVTMRCISRGGFGVYVCVCVVDYFIACILQLICENNINSKTVHIKKRNKNLLLVARAQPKWYEK